MNTDTLRQELTAAYADVTLPDPVDQVVRRGRRIRRARRARRVGPALVAVAAAVVAVGALHDDRVGPGPVELVGYTVPAFPLGFDELPAGLTGPSLSLDPSFERVGPGTAHAGWGDPDDAATGIGISVSADEPDTAGDDRVGETTVDGVDADVYRTDVTGAGPAFSVVWERRDDQWVRVFAEGRFGSQQAAVSLARRVVDAPTAVPLELAVAPRGWEVVAYKDDRILTLADPAGDPATEATARTVTVHLVTDPSPAEDLPRDVGATGGRMTTVTVQGAPAYLLPTAEGWFLQAVLPDGTAFTVQAPGDLTEQQVVQLADGVSRR